VELPIPIEERQILRVLQRVAASCSVLQRVAVRCSVLQCVAVCCSVLQCVAVNDNCGDLLQSAPRCSPRHLN